MKGPPVCHKKSLESGRSAEEPETRDDTLTREEFEQEYPYEAQHRNATVPVRAHTHKTHTKPGLVIISLLPQLTRETLGDCSSLVYRRISSRLTARL